MSQGQKPSFSKWKCFICGGEVVEGQRFLWLPGRGYAHIECFVNSLREKLGERLPGDLLALLEVEEALAYTITRLKQARWLTGSEELRREIDEERKRVEGLAARASKKLSELLEGYGLEF